MPVRVLHYVAKMDRAGQETLIMNVFRNIDADKVGFDFLCELNEKGEYDDEIALLGGKISRLGFENLQGKTKLLKKFWILYKRLKERKGIYDVFHIHTQHAMSAFFASAVAKFAGIKTVIVHSHNASTLYHPNAHKVFKPLLSFLKIERLACSQEAGRWLFGNKHFSIINNGIDTGIFSFNENIRNDVRNRLGWNGKKIIGHVGRFSDQKNHVFLLEVFKIVHEKDPQTSLVLIGKGENESGIKEFIIANDLGQAVSLLGQRDDIYRLYQGMDLFLFPSRFEGLPVVLVEAQAASLPCLISDVIPKDVDISEYIHRESLEKSAEEWAEKALCLLNSCSERQSTEEIITEAGFDIKYTAQVLQNIYLTGKAAE